MLTILCFVVGHWFFPITNYQLPITHYQLPITNYPLPITNYPLPITNYQPRRQYKYSSEHDITNDTTQRHTSIPNPKSKI
ncbi:hypothetical protein CBP14_18005 [Fischerella thermalis WC245]|nr:hypothetical protein CBP14_18005 [Fischerella thermalis WC245]